MKNLKNTTCAALLCITFLSSISSALFQPLIVNGRPVQLGENYSNHTVGLGDLELFCTGVIIDAHHIVTAAHCEDGLLGGKVYFGTSGANFEYRTITAVTPHPDYCVKATCGTSTSIDDFDILVIKFDGNLPHGFTPVPVASKKELASGASIHLAGFGANEFGLYEDILKVTEVPMDRFNGESEFRTIETASGSCSGDSGGPAFIMKANQLYLAGLTSRGDGPCRSHGIYTMVDFFSGWVHEISQKP